MDDQSFRQFLQNVFKNAFNAMNSGAAYYIWHADSEGYNFRGAIKDNAQVVRQCLIWVKDSLVTTHDDAEFKEGHFVIQCHNDKMLAEARNLYYRVIK
jgi:site-specific DNA-methyltransferase (adenine-specific)